MRVGPSKEYGDTPTITLRFRTLGMTLSRGKSPQAGQNNLLSPPHPSHFQPPNSLKQCSFSFIIDPSARSSPLFLRDHFYQPHDTHSRSPAPSPSAPAYRRPRPVYYVLSGRPSPSNLIHFSLLPSARALVSQDPWRVLKFLRRTIIFIWHVSIPNRFIDLWLALYIADKYPVSTD